ncbi:MAG: NAD(P)/FAD-dependent oxidoreductase [Deltaproteobacteria bacterium]|nr:NAD(P)/FAD-dependent oxidoreductase [Deltaproteobacteria bacterium]
MPEYDYDVLVLGGGGSAGFTAATTAMKHSELVGMVENARLGGLCILAGCMPSKALLHSAASVHALGGAGREVYPKVRDFKRAVVDYLAGGREEDVAAKQEEGLHVIRGTARFRDPHTVEVDGNPISAAAVVVATGSREQVPPIPGLDQVEYLDSTSLMVLPELPESVVILGGGTVAVEMAQYLIRMGVKVSVVQRSSHLLSSLDPRVGRILAEKLTEEGGQIYTGTEIRAVKRGGGGVVVNFLHQDQEVILSAQRLLLAVGRVPDIADLALERAGVDRNAKGRLKVDRFMRTSQPHIFAAGDVTGLDMIVNLAIAQGKAAGYNAVHPEAPREVEDRVMPQAIFTDPEYARVGLTTAQAKREGRATVSGEYSLEEMGVARTYPERLQGFMSLVADAGDGRILGGELLCPGASLIIHEVALAMQLHGTVRDLRKMSHIHPCLSEIVESAAYQVRIPG